jgi:GT2 family glycosyltransferase
MPKVSFLVPVYNTDPLLLRICVNSILHVLGEKNQLILVDDGSDNTDTLGVLEKCRTLSDFDVTVAVNSENCGVSYALNKAAKLSRGDLLAPVDHDDLLVTIGFHLAMRYQKYFHSSWMYTDEVQVDARGYFINNLFKPVFCKQLLRSLMYINHLQLFSHELFERAGGYREGFEGSQDHDLALRMSELVIPTHAPVIGYHWRIQPDTQSRQQFTVTNQSVENSRRAVIEHLQRGGYVANVKIAKHGTSIYQARINSDWKPKLSVIIPCHLGTRRVINGNEIVLLEHCLKSLQESTNDFESDFAHPRLEVILILNHEDDVSSANYLLEYFGLFGHSIQDEHGFNFARKCNLGAEKSNGEVLVFLNDDTQFLTNDWLDSVISILTEDDVACVGGMLLNADGTVQSCGDIVGHNSADHYVPDPLPTNVGDPMQRYIADHETTSVTGAFFCCRRTIFRTLEGFSEAFPNSFQDVDFCLRARRKHLRCIIAPNIRLLHFESSSRDPAVDPQTLNSFRFVLADMLTPEDPFRLWRYQKIRVRWLTIGGLIHARNRFKIITRLFLLGIVRALSKKTRTRYKFLID